MIPKLLGKEWLRVSMDVNFDDRGIAEVHASPRSLRSSYRWVHVQRDRPWWSKVCNSRTGPIEKVAESELVFLEDFGQERVDYGVANVLRVAIVFEQRPRS